MWWTFVLTGVWDEIKLGPFKGRDEALKSLEPLKCNADFNQLVSLHSLRLAGPFLTKDKARKADISTCLSFETI